LEQESEQESEQELEQESEQESEQELEQESEQEKDTYDSSKPKPKTRSEEELSVFGTSSSKSILGSELLDIETDNESNDSDASEGHSPRSVVVKEGKICQYCEKKITKNNLKKCLKTKIRDNQDQDKTIWFCTCECFENYKFPSYKNNIRNGRKGGRFDSRERDKKKK
jgi:hypothetical protein